MRLIESDALGIITVWQEARGETLDGKIAVAEVIRNRTMLKYQSDGTIEGTCLRPFQFSGWNPTDRNRIPSLRCDLADPSVRDCRQAWQMAWQGTHLTRGATHYLNLATVGNRPPAWYDPSKVTVKIGAHTFLKLVDGGDTE